MCNHCEEPDNPIPGCEDKLPAKCVPYGETTVEAALDAIQFPVFIPALVTYLAANPTAKAALKAALD